MAETLLDALVKLNFEGEDAVGKAADAVTRIAERLKGIQSLPGVDFNLGQDLPKTFESIDQVQNALRQLIPLAEQAEAALRDAGSGKGGANTQRANNIRDITEALRSMQAAWGGVEAAQTRANESAISQSRAVEARMEKQKRLIEEMLRLNQIDAMQAAQMRHGIEQGRSIHDVTQQYVGATTRPPQQPPQPSNVYQGPTTPLPVPALPRTGAGGAGSVPPNLPPTAGPSGYGGRFTNWDDLVASIQRTVSRTPDPVLAAKSDLARAQREEREAKTHLNSLTKGDEDYEAALIRGAQAIARVERANKALEKATADRAAAEAAAAEAARKAAQTRGVQTSVPFGNLLDPDQDRFLRSVGVDTTADRNTQHIQAQKRLNEMDQFINQAKAWEVTSEEELGKLLARRLRLADISNGWADKEAKAAQANAEKQRVQASPQVKDLHANSDDFLRSINVDPTADIATQRVQLAKATTAIDQQLNELKVDEVGTEEKRLALTKQRGQIEVASNAAAEKERAATQAAADAKAARRSPQFAVLKEPDDAKFLNSVGVDTTAPIGERRLQLARLIAANELQINEAKRDEVKNSQEITRLTSQRARLVAAERNAQELEKALIDKRLEAERQQVLASKDSRLGRLVKGGSDPTEYAKDRGIDTGEPLTRQRIELSQQENLLKRQAIAEEAKRIQTLRQDGATLKRVAELDQQMSALVRQEIQLRQQSAVLAAREKKAAGGSGGFLGGLLGKNEDDDGFGQGFAYSGGMTLRYYAMYAAFAALQQALGDVFTMTEQYTLAVNDLAIAMGSSYEEATKASDQYVQIGRQFGTGPVESIEGATKGLRTFRNPDGSTDNAAGTAFTRLTGLINTIEPEDRRANSAQDMIAIAKAFNISASGLEGLYDKMLSVGQEYGYKTPGEILSGTAAVADIGRESGYTPEALAAAVASIQQGTGTTSDAAAGDLKRFFGAQNDPALVRLFERYKVDQDGTFKQKIDQLGIALRGVDPEQRSRDLTSLGGPRIASAINALIAGLPQQGRAEEGAQTAGGMAAKQAQQQLDELGGLMSKLGAELKGLFASLANSGLGTVFGAIVKGVTQTVTALRQMVDLWNILPGYIKNTAAAILILLAAAKAQMLLTGAGTAVTGLLGRLGLGAAAAANAGPVVAPAFGGLAGAGTGAAASGLAKVASGLGGVAMAAGRLVVALAPLAAIIGTILLVSAMKESADNQQATAENVLPINDKLQTAITTHDIAGAEAGIAGLKQSAIDIEKGNDGFVNGVINLYPGLKDQRKALIDAVNARIAQAQKDVDAYKKEDALLDSLLPRSEWFGKNYNNITGGVALIKAKGVDAHKATSILGDLLQQNPTVVQNALQPGEGQQGAGEIQDYIMQLVGAGNDPLQQERSYSELSNVLRAAKTNVERTGDDTQIASLKLLQDQVDRAWAASVVDTTKAKIDVAAGSFVGKQSEQAIRAILTDGLNKTVAAGDVNAIVQLLNMADRNFIDSYRAGLKAQTAVLTSVQDSLNAALGAFGEAFDSPVDPRGGSVKDELKADMQTKARKKVQSLFGTDFNAQNKALDEALKLANPTGSATSKPGDDLAAAKALEGATAGNGEEQAQAAVKAAQIRVDALKRNHQENTAAYYDALKALNDSKYALAQYEQNKALAQAAAQVQPGNPLAAAKNAIEAIKTKLQDPNLDPTEFWNLTKQLADQQYAYSEMQLSIAEARATANVRPNDPMAAAVVTMQQAQARMARYKGVDDAKYWEAFKQYRQSQYDLAKMELDMANNAALLRIDITDPVALAQQRTKQAADQLAFDRKRGAGKDVLSADEVALRQARSDEAGTKWSQTFNDMRTNYDLNKISLSAYMKYLQSQHDYLSAVKVKTRIQVEQLNEVDSALKGLTESMNGQWNLGDIKVPTAYEMRRALTGGAQATSVSYVTITMTGSSTAEMKAALQGAIGQPILQTVGTTAPKV